MYIPTSPLQKASTESRYETLLARERYNNALRIQTDTHILKSLFEAYSIAKAMESNITSKIPHEETTFSDIPPKIMAFHVAHVNTLLISGVSVPMRYDDVMRVLYFSAYLKSILKYILVHPSKNNEFEAYLSELAFYSAQFKDGMTLSVVSSLLKEKSVNPGKNQLQAPITKKTSLSSEIPNLVCILRKLADFRLLKSVGIDAAGFAVSSIDAVLGADSLNEELEKLVEDARHCAKGFGGWQSWDLRRNSEDSHIESVMSLITAESRSSTDDMDCLDFGILHVLLTRVVDLGEWELNLGAMARICKDALAVKESETFLRKIERVVGLKETFAGGDESTNLMEDSTVPESNVLISGGHVLSRLQTESEIQIRLEFKLDPLTTELIVTDVTSDPILVAPDLNNNAEVEKRQESLLDNRVDKKEPESVYTTHLHASPKDATVNFDLLQSRLSNLFPKQSSPTNDNLINKKHII